MSSDTFTSLLSNVWSIFLIVLFFGGSIFVHELGHFLAARRRGVKVTRFSIGFGPAIWSHTGADGVEYRLSWIPLGGYVALPQLADMPALEGETEDIGKLPPVSYTTKVIVFCAGAFFNVLFALALACLVWVIGEPTISDLATTQVGNVQATLKLPDGTTVPSPASEAGIKPGDLIVSIDGKKVANFDEIITNIFLGHDRTADGRGLCHVVIDRKGEKLELTLYPRLVSEEKIRFIGIEPAQDLTVDALLEGYPAGLAGVRPGDRILAIDGQTVYTRAAISDHVAQAKSRPAEFTLLRDGKEVHLSIQPRMDTDERTQAKIARVGIRYRDPIIILHPTPFAQISENVSGMYYSVSAILSPGSDIGLSKLSGPIGIAREFHRQAQWDFRRVLWFTILININLAIFNLMPIPVLDGGHIVFATVGKLRGRPLPFNFIAATQSVFIVLLLSMVLYVTVFGDIRRWISDNRAEAQAKEAAADQKKPAEPAKP
jgi:regulator of sigma E protease